MFYSFELNSFPTITQYYSVTRNTVWEINNMENILIIITKGKCCFSYDGDSFIAKKGDAVFIPSNHSYLRKSVNNELCSMTYIHFSMDSEPEQLESAEISHKLSMAKQNLDNDILSETHSYEYPHTIYIQSLMHIDDTDKINSYLKEIDLFSVSREFMCYFQSNIALCGILASLSQAAISSFTDKHFLENKIAVPSNLKKAISFIRKNYSEEITLDKLVSCCNVSKQQVIRYFKAAFNTTPINYVLEYKVSKARELLLFQPQLTVKEIAAELGFDNQHYFSRIFKKITGETPSQYKYRVHNYIPPEE